MNRFRCGLEQKDRGAYAILYAMLIMVMVGITGLVLDLATLRLDRRANRAAADSAVVAAAAHLGQAGSDPREACQKAVSYAEANLAITTPGANTCATTFPTAEADVEAACAANRKLVAEDVPSYPAGSAPDRDRFRIEVSWPVPDTDPLMTDPDRENTTSIVQGISSRDGDPCQRMAVEIVQHDDFAFAGIFGFSGQTTSSRSVGLSDVGGVGEVPAPLVVLDEHSCDALVVNGGGGGGDTSVVVQADPSGKFGGLIALDSDAADSAGDIDCTGGKTVISSPSSQGHIRVLDGAGNAKGAIQVYAPAFTAALPSPPGRAYDPADVCTGGVPTSNDGVCPIPTPRQNRVTAAPWVDRYNCATTPTDCNGEGELPILDRYDFITQWTQFSQSLSPGPTWTNLTNCTINGDVTVTDAYAYTDCPTLRIDGGATLSVGGTLLARHDLDIRGKLSVGGNLVVLGSVDVKDCLLINFSDFAQCSGLPPKVTTPGLDGGNTYIGGDLTSTGANANLMIDQAFVYLNGRLDWGATGGFVSWVAPYGSQSTCSIAPSPSPACFEDLALWVAGSGSAGFQGGACVRVDGTFFLPAREFSFKGSTCQDMDRAQFVAKRLVLGGGGTLTMTPNMKRSTPIPGSGGGLIR